MAAQRAGALAVDDADAGDVLFMTGSQVFGDQVAHVRWIKDVQVQDAVDGVVFHGVWRREMNRMQGEGSVTIVCAVKTPQTDVTCWREYRHPYAQRSNILPRLRSLLKDYG